MGGRRRVLPLSLGLILTALIGVVGLPSAGEAAPRPIPLPTFGGAAPTAADLPGGAHPVSPGPVQVYQYPNAAEAFRGRAQPSDVEVEAARYSDNADKAGTWEHILTRWREYQLRKDAELAAYTADPANKERPSRKQPWKTWLNGQIPRQGNDAQGKAFQLHVAERLRLGADFGWKTEVQVPEVNRQYDLANPELGLYYEVKSGTGIDLKTEFPRDKAFVEGERGKPNPRTLVYIFPSEPTKAARTALQSAGIPYFVVPAKKQPVIPGGGGQQSGGGPQGGAAVPDDTLRAPDQFQAPGAAPEEITGSPETAEDAVEARAVQKEESEASGHPELAEDLGGVDFSTLELRYVSDTYHHGPGVQYAFKANSLEPDQNSFGGARNARLASDSFFVWLELPPSAFTVNLNPDEPDRIIDAKFGKTDAGRVLLEADLAMKKIVARFIHPDTPAGQKFWDSLQGDTKCISMRQWIVPDTATVRDTGDELYILDAPLLVKMESDVVKAQGVGGSPGCTQQDKAVTKHNEDVYRQTILPQVQDAVNRAPEYADLRRVYASRVAAEWFRQRSTTKHTAYSDLVGKGDISQWSSREPWSPREVFDRYVQSYKNGEFKVTHTTTSGETVYTYTYVYGGVNFSRINQNRVSAEKFAKDHPELAAAARGALNGPSGDGSGLWLGGQTTAVPPAEAFATPPQATSNRLFYPLAATPLVLWLTVGGVLLLRRRRMAARGSTR
ncbi:hypothetical protein [Streptomyces sp. NRRL WC-3742]|uniref:hypothetical protein n=1 Tax=Streptomyces sp. NRRL WC-3742 TaxID=1463934 RepID=UPI000AA02EDF|nr:hypothetical protein [Streptomyces sp. NRRL WC-3742]